MAVPRERLAWMHDGEGFFLGGLDDLGDDDLREPSGLPGWSRAHVVSHFARNARALINLLDWARTGVATPMYPSVEARADGIEEGSHQSAADLRAEAHAASQQLLDATAAMPDDAWDGEIRTALGRATTGAEVPWMRVRETWVHAIDLDAGGRTEQIPDAIAVALIDEVTTTLHSRDDCPGVVLRASDTSRDWTMGPAEGAVTLKGPQASILGWVIGRSRGDGLHASGGTLPPAPRWI
jgi:maleylpyruvate isomerase